MRQSTILLELKSGRVITGIAKNLVTKDATESLILAVDSEERTVNLMDIDVLVFSNTGERISIS